MWINNSHRSCEVKPHRSLSTLQQFLPEVPLTPSMFPAFSRATCILLQNFSKSVKKVFNKFSNFQSDVASCYNKTATGQWTCSRRCATDSFSTRDVLTRPSIWKPSVLANNIEELKQLFGHRYFGWQNTMDAAIAFLRAWELTSTMLVDLPTPVYSKLWKSHPSVNYCN